MEKKLHLHIIENFQNILGIKWYPPNIYVIELNKIVKKVGRENLHDKNTRKKLLFQSISKKFELNKYSFRLFINQAARYKIYFNFHEKTLIKDCFNSWNYNRIEGLIASLKIENGLKKHLITFFKPITEADITDFVNKQILPSTKKESILCSLFSAFVFYSFKIDYIQNYFNHLSKVSTDYQPNYYSFLRKNLGQKFKRDLGLSIIKINQEFIDDFNKIKELQTTLFNIITTQYNRLSNHCYLAIKIENCHFKKKNIVWDLFSDIVIYAEKFIEENLKKKYFHPSQIQKITQQYINNIDTTAIDFALSNTGFTYKDCIILLNEPLDKINFTTYPYSILLLLEKNQRDEDIIPCPACRSIEVRGNSYPTIGVKSWECHNIFCSDKSKYNRGKRYSLSSLIKQEAINDKDNLILNGTIKKFRLDVVDTVNDDNVLEFLIKHYSLYGDNVWLYNFNKLKKEEQYGRKIIYKKIPCNNEVIDFYKSSFFKKFAIDNLAISKNKFKNLSTIDNIEVYHGNSFLVLQQFSNNSIDGAVTSPPYYNARSYSQWPNIYCYLYDIYNNAKEVFRVLKPNALYLYNIFDYFDNENIVAFSAMGKKRMILGAYIIYLFKKIGFQIQDNIIWYKGHIQGNRSNNQGNISPYYQAPLNCYEHILCFQKPPITKKLNKFNFIKVHPVIKMIKGKNILGHTAPFPSQIPKLLTQTLPKKSVILDPYAGSFTTARQALKDGIKSINIEKSLDYCNLGMQLIQKEHNSLTFSF